MGTNYIPGGVKTNKNAVLGRYYLLYRCPSCHNEALTEQVLEQSKRWSVSGMTDKQNMRSFINSTDVLEKPFLGSFSGGPGQTGGEGDAAPRVPRGKEEAERDRAFQALGAAFRAGDWSPVEGRVKCPGCGKTQPWSDMGKPWRNTLLAILTAVAFVYGLVALRVLMGDPTLHRDPAEAFIPLGVMVLLSLGYILRRRLRMAAARHLGDPPEYYGPDRLQELKESPKGKLLKPYLGK